MLKLARMRILKWLIIICAILIFLGIVFVLKSTVTFPMGIGSKGTNNSTEVSKSVTIFSDISSIELNLTNQSWLTDSLAELDFWGADKIVYFKPSGFQRDMITVKSLEVHLTDQMQQLGQTVSILPDGKDYIYQAYGMDYDPDSLKLVLYLFVDPEILIKESAQSLERRYSALFWATVFDITHPLKPEHIVFEQRLFGKQEFVKSYLEHPESSFLEISK